MDRTCIRVLFCTKDAWKLAPWCAETTRDEPILSIPGCYSGDVFLEIISSRKRWMNETAYGLRADISFMKDDGLHVQHSTMSGEEEE